MNRFLLSGLCLVLLFAAPSAFADKVKKRDTIESLEGRKVGLILSGGNVDLKALRRPSDS